MNRDPATGPAKATLPRAGARIGVPIGDIVAGEIHAEIAGEQNLLLG